MFVQICFLTAGLYLGRTLLDEWEQLTADEADEGSQPQPLYAVEKSDEEPRTEHCAESLAGQPKGAPHLEETEVNEQLRAALVSAGLTMTTSSLLPRLNYLGGVGVMYGSIPILKRALRLLQSEGRLGIEFLSSVSLIVAIAARNFTSSALIFLLDSVAEKLRLHADKVSRQSMLEVFTRRDPYAWLLKEGAEVKVPIDSLRPDDIVVVSAGSSIPADGVVIKGTARVNQHILTGESQPVEKASGEKVFGMTLLITGRLEVKVTAAGKKAAAAAIAQVLEHTADFASSVELESKKLADASVPPILALSALSYYAVGRSGALALLSLEIADNLRLITPFSLLGHLRKAYQHGILLKDGRSLQLLSTIDTIVFDETAVGTELPREEIAPVLSALRQRNLSLFILSSDPPNDPDEPTRARAEALALPRYFAGVQPADKAQLIRDLQQEGRSVCFVGDGVNDAIALKQSTVSVSIRGAATVAADSAQVVLLDSELKKLPLVFSIADDFQRNLHGIYLSAGIPAVVAAGGVLTAGFTTPAVIALDLAGIACGVAVAARPYLQKDEAPNTPGENYPDQGHDPAQRP